MDKVKIPQTQAERVISNNIKEAVKTSARQVKELNAKWKEAMSTKEAECSQERVQEKQK